MPEGEVRVETWGAVEARSSNQLKVDCRLLCIAVWEEIRFASSVLQFSPHASPQRLRQSISMLYVFLLIPKLVGILKV